MRCARNTSAAARCATSRKGACTILAAGTGNPFFTTDTAASLRAIEINADLLLKATKVNGIYSDDPMKNPAATRYTRLTFDKVLTDRLNVMDATAIVMCRDNNLPLRVFDLTMPGELLRIVRGEDVGTLVTNHRTDSAGAIAPRRVRRSENSHAGRHQERRGRAHAEMRRSRSSNELKRLRTGRAHPSLLEHIRVEYYGNEVPLNQVANVALEDARTITVTPWEKTMVQVIEKAIMKSDLGLMPATAGTVIRVPMPPLTEERRRDLTKVVRHEAENARVAVRNVRRDVMNELKDMLKEKLRVAGRRSSRAGRGAEAHRQARRGDRPGAGRKRKRADAGLSVGTARFLRRCPMSARPDAAPHRGHHGRQRPLGRGARAAASCRSSHGRAIREADRRELRPARRRGADAVRVLERELEAAARRSVDADGPLPRSARRRKSTSCTRTRSACASSAISRSCRTALRERMHEGDELTAGNTRMTLVIAVAYGGRWDIAQAARELARRCAAGRDADRRDRRSRARLRILRWAVCRIRTC